LSVREVATQFVDGFVRASDEVAVVNVQGPRTSSQELTTRKELVRDAIGRYGQGLSGDTSVVTDETSGSVRLQRHLMTLQSLRETTERLGTITGRRKAILWVGGQIVYEMPECPFGRDTSTLACQLQLNWGQVLAAHRELIGAATRSNVTIHAVDPCGLTPAIGRVELDRQAALRHIAQDTGGVAIVNTNKFADGFAAVDRDSSLYYIVNYAPAITYHDGKFHEVKVRVRRKGLSARSRKGYVALPSPH
jgi:VWFA-related protein